MDGVNVTAIHSCYAATAVRRWSPAADRRDRSLDGDRFEVRTGSDADGDAYVPSSIASPVQPPWRVLPWPRAAAAAHRPAAVTGVVKAYPGLADMTLVGRTLDLFV